MFSRPKILFLVSLLFVALLNPKFNPYLPFKFFIFIILVCLLFIRAKTNILNVNEQIIFLKNEYSNILYIISISLIALNHKGTGRCS